MSNKLSDFIKVAETISYADQPKGKKLKSLAESSISGRDVIDFLIKMKNGPLTTIKLFLDTINSDEVGDVYLTFRLLTAKEQCDIEQEMLDSKLLAGTMLYNIRLSVKILSRASKSIISNDELYNQPHLSEAEMLDSLTPDVLLGLLQAYLEFKQKYCPRVEFLTEEYITDIIRELDSAEVENDPVKKLILLNSLRLQSMRDLIVNLHLRLLEQTKQLDKFVTGL